MKNFIYWLCVAFSICIVLTINMIFDFSFNTILSFLITFFYLALPSILVGLLFVNILPKKLYSEDKSIFVEKPFEKKIYRNMHVKEWKDFVPQFLKIDNINDAKKEKINTQSSEYIKFFISETCRSELLHCFYIVSEFVMLFLLFFIKTDWALKFGLAITIIWSIFNIMPLFIQRYNRPRLKLLLKRVEKNEEQGSINK